MADFRSTAEARKKGRERLQKPKNLLTKPKNLNSSTPHFPNKDPDGENEKILRFIPLSLDSLPIERRGGGNERKGRDTRWVLLGMSEGKRKVAYFYDGRSSSTHV